MCFKSVYVLCYWDERSKNSDLVQFAMQCVWVCSCVCVQLCGGNAWSEDITTDPQSLPDSLSSRSDLNQFTNSIMLSPNIGWGMMNDYVKHIISLLHHHCNMTAKFHSSYPISSLFKERKLLVPVIRYVARLCAGVKPTPIRLSALLWLYSYTLTHIKKQIHMFHMSDPTQFSRPLSPISRTMIWPWYILYNIIC